MYKEIKKRTYEILGVMREGDRVSLLVNSGLVALVLLNVAAIILETEPGFSTKHFSLFRLLDGLSFLLFFLEYILRLWVCTEDPKYSKPVLGRIRYALTPLAIIDLVSILPLFLTVFFQVLFRWSSGELRIVRMLLILRLLKLARYSESADMLKRVFLDRKKELLITLVVGLALVIISSTLMYYAEHGAQPEQFPSILGTMWWAVMTLTTIGASNIYPVTSLGKFFGALTAIFGLLMFALPAGLISSGFLEEVQKRRRKNVEVCPHCGKNIYEKP